MAYIGGLFVGDDLSKLLDLFKSTHKELVICQWSVALKPIAGFSSFTGGGPQHVNGFVCVSSAGQGWTPPVCIHRL